jgi:hypothetical protein
VTGASIRVFACAECGLVGRAVALKSADFKVVCMQAWQVSEWATTAYIKRERKSGSIPIQRRVEVSEWCYSVPLVLACGAIIPHTSMLTAPSHHGHSSVHAQYQASNFWLL